MLFASSTHQTFTPPHYNIAEYTIIFQYSLQFCQQSSCAFQQNKYFHPAAVSLLPLQPLTHNTQGMVPAHDTQGMVPSQAVFQNIKQEKLMV
jgi:hypothetical protein